MATKLHQASIPKDGGGYYSLAEITSLLGFVRYSLSSDAQEMAVTASLGHCPDDWPGCPLPGADGRVSAWPHPVAAETEAAKLARAVASKQNTGLLWGSARVYSAGYYLCKSGLATPRVICSRSIWS